MAVPTLIYGSESWINRRKDRSKIEASEMAFLRSVKGCTKYDRIRSDDIRQELQMFKLTSRIEQNKENWREHMERMPEERLPNMALHYKPRGRRDPGRPRKRWLETGTGASLIPVSR